MIRAAVFDGPGRPFRFKTLPRPVLRDGEALVRIKLCTVCGSDLHTFAGRRGGPTPCVLGHEAVGVVEELRGAVGGVDSKRPVEVGDRVVWSVTASCGDCFFCLRRLPQKCTALRKFGHESFAGVPVGGLATHCVLPAGTAIVRVPDAIPDAAAALAGCAVATAIAAVSEGAKWYGPVPLAIARRTAAPGITAEQVLADGPPYTTPGGVAVILGAGLVGLSACAALAAAGAKPAAVVACDVSDSRLSLARRFGATHTTHPADAVELARSLTDGRGADFVLEASGSPAAAALSLDVARVGGKVVWVGTVSPTPSVPVDPEKVVRRCLELTGVHNYPWWHLALAVGLLGSGRFPFSYLTEVRLPPGEAHAQPFPFAELVERSFPLDEVNEAFRFAEAEKPVRVAVENPG